MAHIWFMHDAHLSCALFFLDMLAEYTLLSMTVMVSPCLWYVVGMKLVYQVSSSPFCTRPFWRMPNSLVRIFRLQPGLERKFLLRRTCCWGENCSHCSFQDFHSLSKGNQVSLVRTFLSEPGSQSKISRLGGWGWKNDPDDCLDGGNIAEVAGLKHRRI